MNQENQNNRSTQDDEYSGVLIKAFCQFFNYLGKKINKIHISPAAAVLTASVLVLTGFIGIKYIFYNNTDSSSIFPASQTDRELPIYCVQTDEPKIVLTFDAAWGNEDTQTIMEILRKHDVKVTFFMTGGWVESYPEDVKLILSEGHDLGNHSENHKNMSQLSNSDKKNELMTVHDKVKNLTGYDMFLFRPPYGDYDNEVIRVAKECGYYPIQWDVDTLVM